MDGDNFQYIPHEDQNRSALRTPLHDSGIEQPPGQAALTKSVKPTVRVRRNALQAIQDHLAGSSRDTRSNNAKEGVSGPVLPSSTKSRAPTTQASFPRDEALRPEHPSPSDEAVPSLLLRLSDPVRTTSEQPRNAENNAAGGSQGLGRETLSAPKGNGISASEMMTRTRGQPVQTVEGVDPPAASPFTQSHQPRRAAGRQRGRQHDLDHREGGVDDVRDVAEVGLLMSSESRSGRATAPLPLCLPPREADQVLFAPLGASAATRARGEARSAPPSADPRFLLMQKLELEKRKALDVPIAEKTQLSSSDIARHDAPSIPMAGFSGEHTKSGVPGEKVVAAERQAERREVELRSQAQLRVRLAAAKRAALQAAATGTDSITDVGTGSSSPTNVNENLQSQELALKSKLRARRA